MKRKPKYNPYQSPYGSPYQDPYSNQNPYQPPYQNQYPNTPPYQNQYANPYQNNPTLQPPHQSQIQRIHKVKSNKTTIILIIMAALLIGFIIGCPIAFQIHMNNLIKNNKITTNPLPQNMVPGSYINDGWTCRTYIDNIEWERNRVIATIYVNKKGTNISDNGKREEYEIFFSDEGKLTGGTYTLVSENSSENRKGIYSFSYNGDSLTGAEIKVYAADHLYDDSNLLGKGSVSFNDQGKATQILLENILKGTVSTRSFTYAKDGLIETENKDGEIATYKRKYDNKGRILFETYTYSDDNTIHYNSSFKYIDNRLHKTDRGYCNYDNNNNLVSAGEQEYAGGEQYYTVVNQTQYQAYQYIRLCYGYDCLVSTIFRGIFTDEWLN